MAHKQRREFQIVEVSHDALAGQHMRPPKHTLIRSHSMKHVRRRQRFERVARSRDSKGLLEAPTKTRSSTNALNIDRQDLAPFMDGGRAWRDHRTRVARAKPHRSEKSDEPKDASGTNHAIPSPSCEQHTIARRSGPISETDVIPSFLTVSNMNVYRTGIMTVRFDDWLGDSARISPKVRSIVLH